MKAREVNFDGLVGLTHHYAGLSFGNEASTKHRFQVSNPKLAAKQGLLKMKALSDIGLQLSITGGITPADLPLFKQINVKAFIAGRALAGAANPPQVAQAFHSQIRDIWGE